MTEPVLLGYGNNKWLKDANTKMVTLYQSVEQSAPIALKSFNVDYVVPAGKKFIILKLNFAHATTSPKYFVIRYFTSASSASGTIFYYAKIDESAIPEIDCYIEIPAGNYINFDSLTAEVMLTNCTGIETDA
jgi:hypothetical protein